MTALLIASAPASTASSTSTVYTAGFATPAGLALDSAGSLYVSDYATSVVSKVSLLYGVPTLTPLGSGFRYPLGLAVDGAKNVYVADYGNGRVEKIAENGTQTDVGSGYTYPAGVALGPSGDVFVTDVHDVVQVTPGGVKTTVASGFEFAQGIARDSAGNLFVTDTKNGVGYVARIDALTHAVSTAATGLTRPVGLALEPSGDLVVAEPDASLVVRVTTGGKTIVLTQDAYVPSGVTVTPTGDVLTGSLGDPVMKTGKILQVATPSTAPAIKMSALPSVSLVTNVAPSWTSSAIATMAAVDVRYRSASAGAALPATYTSLTAGTRQFTASLAGAPDTRYCFSAKSRTSLGAESNWSAESCTSIPMDDRGLVRGKAWTLTSDAGWLASTSSTATVKGASLTTPKVRKVSSVAVLGWTCPACGTADIYVGPKKIGSISLKSTTSKRVLLPAIKLAKAQSGKVSLVVTSSGKWVKIDGIALG
jgi:sugar lactone lactonase YvrE